jgi:hypothetical protein
MRKLHALLLLFALMVASSFTVAAATPARHTTKKSTASKITGKTVSKKGSDVSVRGYTKKNGTHVQPSHRTAPNGTQKDNFSAKGKLNPYTGKKGTKMSKK